MSKTLKELLQDANSGRLYLKMVIRSGTADIPERFSNYRKVLGHTNSVLRLDNGKNDLGDTRPSQLDVKPASLVEYTDESLTVYKAGLRPLTRYEQGLLARWESVRDKEQERIDALSDGSVSYWQKIIFFKKNDAEYLLGYEWKSGKRYDITSGQVYDKKVKGAIDMQYLVATVCGKCGTAHPFTKEPDACPTCGKRSN